jgi:hypothetical protein
VHIILKGWPSKESSALINNENIELFADFSAPLYCKIAALYLNCDSINRIEALVIFQKSKFIKPPGSLIICLGSQVPEGHKYEKDYILGLLQSFIKPHTFIPLGVGYWYILT